MTTTPTEPEHPHVTGFDNIATSPDHPDFFVAIGRELKQALDAWAESGERLNFAEEQHKAAEALVLKYRDQLFSRFSVLSLGYMPLPDNWESVIKPAMDIASGTAPSTPVWDCATCHHPVHDQHYACMYPVNRDGSIGLTEPCGCTATEVND